MACVSDDTLRSRGIDSIVIIPPCGDNNHPVHIYIVKYCEQNELVTPRRIWMGIIFIWMLAVILSVPYPFPDSGEE